MSRTKKMISIDDKIKNAEMNVAKAKSKYDAAVGDLKLLLDKRNELKTKELLDAVASSEKTYDEILAFINS